MANYVWNKELETGNTMIDEQHKKLIQAINELLDACAAGKGRDIIDKTIKFLSDYTAKHFADEENLQIKSKYPDYANHKKLHDNFKVTVSDLAAKLRKDGATVALIGQVNTSIGGWLISHIKKEDTKLALHIKSR